MCWRDRAQSRHSAVQRTARLSGLQVQAEGGRKKKKKNFRHAFAGEPMGDAVPLQATGTTAKFVAVACVYKAWRQSESLQPPICLSMCRLTFDIYEHWTGRALGDAAITVHTTRRAQLRPFSGHGKRRPKRGRLARLKRMPYAWCLPAGDEASASRTP